MRSRFRRSLTAVAAALLVVALACCQPAGASTVDVAGERVDADAAELTQTGKRLSAEDLEKVASLPDPRSFAFGDTNVTDFAPISSPSSLESLDLTAMEVGDLSFLAGLSTRRVAQ